MVILTNVADTLAAQGRIGVWVSGTTLGVKWRICVVVSWGRFTSSDDRVTVDFAESDAHTHLQVTYTTVTSPTASPPSSATILHGFNLDAVNEAGTKVVQFDKTYLLIVHYTDEELAAANVPEESLQLAYWDEEKQEWVLIPTAVEAENNVAVGVLNHLTEFALWGSESGMTSVLLPLISR